ncbi:hypothetical protein OROMI_026136 [Orobanche minor]
MCGAAAVAINQGWVEGSSDPSWNQGWWCDLVDNGHTRRNWESAARFGRKKLGGGDRLGWSRSENFQGLTDKNRVLGFVLGRKVELKTHMVFSDGEKK